MPENKINQWHNCYDEGWKDLIVPEAFSHPAKMSYGLLKRILEHAKGWLNEGDVILDPFGGIGSTGILGAYEGYQVVCCELEQKFVDLAEKNFELHKDAWVEFGNPFPIILQGDSRRLCEIVEKADCIVSSPPYIESINTKEHGIKDERRTRAHNDIQQTHYGQTPGQLGAMKHGKVDMVVSSPPFGEAGDRSRSTIQEGRVKEAFKRAYDSSHHGNTKGNLGNLKSGDVDCVISSPPYEEGIGHGGNPTEVDKEKALHIADSKRYSESNDNLGNQRGDTFWQAANTIVEQCHQILKPGGHAIWVVKSFVHKKKIVDFPGDWQRLCESVGFKTVCIHHAMLVKETSHKTLFGDTETKRKERKSFFRRLAESKGSPRIDYEVVLCIVK